LLKKYFFMIFVICAAIAVAGCAKRAAYSEMTAAQVLEIYEQENILLIDVREEWEFREGRIPGAILLPLGKLDKNYQQLGTDAKIILVCRSGNRSGTAAKFLAEKGYKNVYNMVGGMLAWKGIVETGD